MPELKKCKMCGDPLNSETASEKDKNICFECAEEPRKFTPEAIETEQPSVKATQKKSWWKFW